jgi:hypothetical protein
LPSGTTEAMVDPKDPHPPNQSEKMENMLSSISRNISYSPTNLEYTVNH